MISLAAFLLVLGTASADHLGYHYPSSHSAAAPQSYAAPVPAYPIASPAPAHRVYTAGDASASGAYAPVFPSPHNVHSYSSPDSVHYSSLVNTYSAHRYTPAAIKTFTPVPAPSVHAYTPAQHSSPIKAYSAPKYIAPAPALPTKAYAPIQYPASEPIKAYSAPQYAHPAPVNTYSYAPAPALPTKSYAPVQYQAPVSSHYPTPSFSSQYVRPVAILRQSQDNNFDGTFSYDFEAENGISSQASGYVKAISPNEEAQVIQGQYSYPTPDGTPIVTRYYADETGFHAEGAHLPVPPPLPEAIAKSLAYNAATEISGYGSLPQPSH